MDYVKKQDFKLLIDVTGLLIIFKDAGFEIKDITVDNYDGLHIKFDCKSYNGSIPVEYLSQVILELRHGHECKIHLTREIFGMMVTYPIAIELEKVESLT